MNSKLQMRKTGLGKAFKATRLINLLSSTLSVSFEICILLEYANFSSLERYPTLLCLAIIHSLQIICQISSFPRSHPQRLICIYLFQNDFQGIQYLMPHAILYCFLIVYIWILFSQYLFSTFTGSPTTKHRRDLFN